MSMCGSEWQRLKVIEIGTNYIISGNLYIHILLCCHDKTVDPPNKGDNVNGY